MCHLWCRASLVAFLLVCLHEWPSSRTTAHHVCQKSGAPCHYHCTSARHEVMKWWSDRLNALRILSHLDCQLAVTYYRIANCYFHLCSCTLHRFLNVNVWHWVGMDSFFLVHQKPFSQRTFQEWSSNCSSWSNDALFHQLQTSIWPPQETHTD